MTHSTNNLQVPTPGKIPGTNTNKNHRALTVVVIIALALIAYLAFYGWHHRAFLHKLSGSQKVGVKSNSNPKVNYNYAQLESYELKSKAQGSSIVVTKPVEFKELAKPTAQQVLLVHFTQDRSVPDFGRLGLEQVKAATDVSGTATKTNYTAADVQSLVLGFVNPRLPLNYLVTSVTPKAYTSSNISQNAWVADFKASHSGSNWPTLQGRAVIVFGQSTTYYFMVENISSIWQSNQTVWQKVINSLKVDQ